MKEITLDGKRLSIADIYAVCCEDASIRIDEATREQVRASRNFVDKERTSQIIYGINTGFGPMASHIIGKNQLAELQINLIRSHAVGMGKPLPEPYVLASMVVRLNTLLHGNSGVSEALIDQLQTFINARIIPVIPEHGAVGTSGDLVQLAHIALGLIGEGEVFLQGERRQTKKVLAERGITPLVLLPKEGLSLINGTSTMTGITALLAGEARQALNLATHSGALSLEIVQSYDDYISAYLHELRPHPGQIAIAQKLRDLTQDSKRLRKREELHQKVAVEADVHETEEVVQEVYSLRCLPQILGPVYDTLIAAEKVIETEMNSVTDNPVIDPKSGAFLHGGNFHGDYIATTLDQLKLTLVKLTLLAERRINFFLNHNVNHQFPPFINLKQPGLSLGLQGLQFVATSTAAQNQTYAYPHSVHTIPTNEDNQDIVSMGTDAALITAQVLDNLFTVLTIEHVTLAQAIDYLKIHGALSSEGGRLYGEVRSLFPAVIDDRSFAGELNNLKEHLQKIHLV